MSEAFELIAGQLADAEAQWSLGTFGAIAEFMRDADEAAEIARDEPLDDGGDAARRDQSGSCDGLRPIAFETITTQAWSQRVAFCLPEAQSAMNRRAVLTELGPDAQALREQDRGAILFDLGLDTAQVDCCIRTSNAELIEGLRGYAGRSLFEAGNPAMGLILRHSPHRVFVTRAGRAEVYQAIPAHGGVSPEGPHTHVLPKLLAHRRTHAATEPIPAGWVSCAHLVSGASVTRRLWPRHRVRCRPASAVPVAAAAIRRSGARSLEGPDRRSAGFRRKAFLPQRADGAFRPRLSPHRAASGTRTRHARARSRAMAGRLRRAAACPRTKPNSRAPDRPLNAARGDVSFTTQSHGVPRAVALG